MMTLDDLRRFAVARSLSPAKSLSKALEQVGFVQADPIRAPARAQDLTLRHRLEGYRAGDLEAQYGALGIEEDWFINYGFVTRRMSALMHPRSGAAWPIARRRRADAILAFIAAHGAVHPRQVDRHFKHGRVTNFWGGSSSATTHLMMLMHYRGLLRVAGREQGIRLYAVREAAVPVTRRDEADARLDALVDVVVNLYAPVQARSLSTLVARLRYATPHWRPRLKEALVRARHRLAHARIDQTEWFWPAGDRIDRTEADEQVRLLAPFDPIVWDRRRFEQLWDWAYRFEAYTPSAKRQIGYYALPMLWRDRVIGWANVSVEKGTLRAQTGYVSGTAPRDRQFRRELDEELDRLRTFLRL